MKTFTAEYVTTEQNYQEETTTYWFLVGEDSFALQDCNGELKLLDSEGYPVEECNDHDNVKQLLIDADPCAFA